MVHLLTTDLDGLDQDVWIPRHVVVDAAAL